MTATPVPGTAPRDVDLARYDGDLWWVTAEICGDRLIVRGPVGSRPPEEWQHVLHRGDVVIHRSGSDDWWKAWAARRLPVSVDSRGVRYGNLHSVNLCGPRKRTARIAYPGGGFARVPLAAVTPEYRR
jgi:hypothetical protein